MDLGLKIVGPNGESYGDFCWPLEVGARVEAPDWDPSPRCGGGLHYWLHGKGNPQICDRYHIKGARWLVVEPLDDEIALNGKCKARAVRVRFVGDRKSATDYLRARDDLARGQVIGADVHVGDGGIAETGPYGTATAGRGGTATAGHGGTATAGHGGTATAGYRGTATAGPGGTATAGDTATAGYRGIATAGDHGTATAGRGGTATAGYRGTATADRGGTATAGHGGTATAGESGTATAGHGGELHIRYWDDRALRYRTAIAYVGENGIEANVAYKLDAQNNFIRNRP